MKTNSQLLIFNPEYKLKHDLDKVLFITKDPSAEKKYGAEEEFMGVIHPIHAMMLSFFNGKSFSEAINGIHLYFDIDRKIIEDTFKKLVKNEDSIQINFFNKFIHFPKNVIIEMTEDMEFHSYNPEMFSYDELNLKFDRLNSPLNLTIMFTSKCMTDCIYCYADRRKKVNCTIPLERIYELIDEAKKLDMRAIDVIGGEFFLYEHWYEVLCKLRECGFMPFLTTKIALKKDDIEKIKDLGFNSIQISLDTMIKKNLLKSVQVTEKYFYNIQKTFELLEKNGFNVQVNTILSSANDSIEDIKSLSKFFSKLGNISSWAINYGEYSIYLGEEAFKKYKAKRENIIDINKYIKKLNTTDLFEFEISSVELVENPVNSSYDEKKDQFDERSTCSGNLYSLFILPDGKVTICEELYWNPHFIIGDITKQTIEEVWTSDVAKNLFYLKQESISSESACSTCGDYDSCREENVKKICWRDTIKAYGGDKWDYPDYRCPIAPKVEKEIFA
jgi:radical SAM protein with 4Fe4S-binding SPASM domain